MASDAKMLTVGQLNEYVKMLIDGAPLLSGLSVRGEISNFKNHYATGHFYFTLKDETGSIKAVMFRSYASRLSFVPKDGMKVIASGRVSVFVRDGAYQLYVEDMQPDGVGALYYAYEQLKAKLEGEGLFSSERKRQICRYPEKIGIVTSPTGAAIQDMLNILGRRYPAAEIYIYGAQVQGPSAPSQLCRGIEYFNTQMPVDTIIIGRGGGSLEDLWAFNNETLARRIAESEIPVISAVGHETDFTICDFVADLRAPTPSAAAELAVPDRAELAARFGGLREALDASLVRKLSNMRTRLKNAEQSRPLTDISRLTEQKKMALLTLEDRLGGAVEHLTENAGMRLASLSAQLGALDPFAVLRRGYAAVFYGDKPLRSIEQPTVGDSIEIRLADGSLCAQITDKKSEK